MVVGWFMGCWWVFAVVGGCCGWVVGGLLLLLMGCWWVVDGWFVGG